MFGIDYVGLFEFIFQFGPNGMTITSVILGIKFFYCGRISIKLQLYSAIRLILMGFLGANVLVMKIRLLNYLYLVFIFKSIGFRFFTSNHYMSFEPGSRL